MEAEMMDNLIGRMSLGKWIALAVVLAVVAFVLLTQFTSFQVPETRSSAPPTSQEPVGVQSQGSTATENNLDAVNEILRGGSESPEAEESSDAN
jgi:cytoskeletal protein RodZ